MAATIDELLRAAAGTRPDAVAVQDGARELSYGELDQRSSRLAALLGDHGVAAGDRVGLLLEKSLEALIAVYGVLKAGATYVPLDGDAPLPRLGFILGDAGIEILISETAQADAWPALAQHGAPLRLVLAAPSPATRPAPPPSSAARAPGPDAVPAPALEVVPWSAIDTYAPAPPPSADPQRLAYILYTSGSTGTPKGVMLSHRAGLAFVQWAAQETGLHAGDRLSNHAPLHFDLSTFDLFGAACAGAPVVLVPRMASVFPIELARFIREQRISVWYSVPSILTQLVLRGDFTQHPPADLRTIVFAGEVFPTKYLRALMRQVPRARYLNFFGPTETNVCTWYEVPADLPEAAGLPIGRPIDGVRAVVEGEDAEPVTRGEPGELVISGPSVMHGYWGDAERTRRVLSTRDGQPTYRTGDLVRVRGDGELEFLGRRDAQIKTRGYRVELGEIEAALNALEPVIECAVVAVPDPQITNRIRAYVVTREPVTAAELSAACAARLPRYMIPEEFELRGKLPKSSTGKIDRQALAREVAGA